MSWGLIGWLTGRSNGAKVSWIGATWMRFAVQPWSRLTAGWLRPGAALSSSAAGPRAALRVVLVRNGEVSDPFMSKDDLLKKFGGAYTTARTIDQSSIFELSMHCTRLYDTAKAVWGKQVEDSLCSTSAAAACREALRFLEDGRAAALKPLLRREIRAALSLLDKEDHMEFQVTVLMTVDTVGAHTPENRGFDVFTYVQPMPSTTPMVDVFAYRLDRSNPTIKDVGWVRAREAMEVKQKEAGVNEVLMFDSECRATEGLQTNFFAVAADGTLLTAPDELVLSGTVRKIVFEVAERSGIPVRMECPDIRRLDEWDSCFICSTSRLVKPISSVEVPELHSKRLFPTEGSVAHRVEALVRQAFRTHAEAL